MGGIEGTAGGETHPQEPISNFGIGLSARISTSRITAGSVSIREAGGNFPNTNMSLILVSVNRGQGYKYDSTQTVPYSGAALP